MRHQFYADSRDAMKWSIMYRLTGKFRGIFWVVTLRPDKAGESTYGNTKHRVDEAEAFIEGFLSSERGKPKDLRRTGKMFEPVGVRFHAHLDDYPNDPKGQGEYWRSVLWHLKERHEDQRDVVFLDPDNGIAGKKCAGEHVSIEHIAWVWEALRPKDVLAVYQHSFRETDWAEKKQKVISAALGCDVAAHGRGVVRFFIKEKAH